MNIKFKILFVTLCLLFFSQYGLSQELNWSAERNLKSGSYIKIVGNNKNYTYVLVVKPKLFGTKVWIEQYDHDLSLIRSKAIEIRKVSIINAFVNDKGLVLLKLFSGSGSQESKVYYELYNNELKLSEKQTLFRYFSKKYKHKIYTTKSYDNKIINLIFLKENNTKIETTHLLFDDNFEPIKQLEFTINENFKHLGFIDAKLASDSSSAFLLKFEKNFKKHYQLYSIKGDSSNNVPLSKMDETLHYPNLSYHRKNQLFIVSAWASSSSLNEKKIVLFEGKAAQKFSRSETILANAIWEKYLGKRLSEGFDINHIKIINTIPRIDGGKVIVAERQEISSNDQILDMVGGTQTLVRNIYSFDEVMVLSINPNDELDWFEIIHKNQSTVNDGGYFSSVAIMTGLEELNFLFNDRTYGDGQVLSIKIDKNGHKNSKILLTAQKQYFNIVPRESQQLSNYEILLPVYKNKKLSLLKIYY